MYRTRVIPALLLKGRGLVKTVKFKDPTYLGDPINVVKIFNDKEVDELVFLDITATIENRPPPFQLISEIASECFMPLGYGGGLRRIEDVKTILGLGVEKVVINSHAVENPDFVAAAVDQAGGQSVVVSIDVRKKRLGGAYEVVTHGGRQGTGLDPVTFAQKMEALGIGELFLNSVDRDGTMQGYDLELIKRVSHAVGIPVVACGGAGNVQNLAEAVKLGGASAASAGSLFVFHGRHRAVLINFPKPEELRAAFGELARS